MKKIVSSILLFIIFTNTIVLANSRDFLVDEIVTLTKDEACQLIDDLNSGKKKLKIPKDNIFEWNEVDQDEQKQITYTQDVESSIDNNEEELISQYSINTTGWTSYSTMTSARSEMSSTVVDDKIYVFGGTESGHATVKTEMFDTKTNLWYNKSEMKYARYKHTTLLNENKIYVCGGYGESDNAIDSISVYDITNDVWLNDIDTPNHNTNFASGIYNNELYIFGGKELGRDTLNAYKYNFMSDSWTELTILPQNVVDEKAVLSQNGFYIFSEWDVIEYNISKDSYTVVDHVPREVEDYAVVSRDIYENNSVDKKNIIYISGGHDSDSNVSTASVKARYIGDNTSTNEWYNDLRLIRGLSKHNMVIVEGYIYVYGGQVVQGTDQRIMFRRSIIETPDDVTQPVNIEENTYQYGSINYDGDSDTYLFTPSETGKYEIIKSTPMHSNNDKYLWHVEISEYKTGNKISYCYEPDILSGIELKANVTYAIKISDRLHEQTGNYMFRVKKYLGDDEPDYAEAANNIEIDKKYSGILSGVQDRDFYKFTANSDGDYIIDLQTDRYEYNYKIQVGTQIVPDTIYYPYNNMNVIIYNDKKEKIESYLLPLTYSNHNFLQDTVIHLKKGIYYISIEPEEYDFKKHNSHDIDGLYYNAEHNTYSIEIATKQVYNNNPLYNRAYHQLTKVNNKLYAIGGRDNTFELIGNVESYDPKYLAWNYETNIDMDDIWGKEREGFASVGNENKIYVIGGYNDFTYGSTNYWYHSDINAYDISTKKWSKVGDFVDARERAGVVIYDNQIYIIGGRGDKGILNSVEVYDLKTNTVSTTMYLPESLMDVQPFFVDDTLYVVGGIGYDGYSDKVYALENNKWVTKSEIPYKSQYLRGTAYNGNFFAAAVNSDGNIDILKYDVLLNKWSIVHNNFLNNRIYFGVEILNGMLYIMGGYSKDIDAITNDVYKYDIVTDIASMDRAIPIRNIGFEFEQKLNNNVLNSPEITGVHVKTIDADKGIYELYLNEEDYVSDVRSIPFFFWSAREGMFSALSEDYRRVMFYADPNTGDRKVKIVVGIGDARGYVDKKAFNLTGNSSRE